VPARSTEAYVLDASAFRERDKIVTLFTLDEGKVRGIAHGAARSVKRFGGRLERLSRVKVAYHDSEGRDLVRIDDLELIEESFRLQQDIVVAAALAYVCEVVGEFVREKESDGRYFRLVGAVIEGFRAGAKAGVMLRYFEFWTARLHGIFPDAEQCDACRTPFGEAGARVGAADGEALCPRCAKNATGRTLALSAAALGAIAAFRRTAPRDLVQAPIAAGALSEIEAAASASLVSFTGREFRSRAFLRQVMQGVSG